MTDTASSDPDLTYYNRITRIHIYLASRAADVAEVLKLILKNNRELPMTDHQKVHGEYKSVANLDYCIVAFDNDAATSSDMNLYTITSKEGEVYYCDNLLEVVELILHRWW